MEETALRYEYLIRAAHQVGRLEIPAAHADTYRGLERAFVLNRDNTNPQQQGTILFEYAYFCGEVATNLSNAIWKFEKDFGNNFTQEDKDDLSQLEDLMVYPQMEEIDIIVDMFENVLKRHGRV